jgi:hypothetical protein
MLATAFAQGVAEGKSSRAAYMAAFRKCRKDVAADASAAKLLAKPAVRARVDELIAVAAEKAGVTIERVVAGLARIGFADKLGDPAVRDERHLHALGLEPVLDDRPCGAEPLLERGWKAQ